MGLLPAGGSNTSIAVSHKLSAGRPSIQRPASDEMNTRPVLLRETSECFLQDQRIGTKVLLFQMHNILHDVDLEPARSLEKTKSAPWCSVSNVTVLIVLLEGGGRGEEEGFTHENHNCFHYT